MSLHSARQLALWYLFKSNNKYGYTSLKLAARYRVGELIRKILLIDNVYSFEYLSLGEKSQCLYDARELDPLLCRNDKVPSVITDMTLASTTLSRSFIELPIVNKITGRK